MMVTFDFFVVSDVDLERRWIGSGTSVEKKNYGVLLAVYALL